MGLAILCHLRIESKEPTLPLRLQRLEDMGATLCRGIELNESHFLELLNEVAKKAKPFHDELTPITDMDAVLTDFGLDSLDLLMCSVYLCEIFDVEDEKSKEMQAKTPRDCMNFVLEHGRRQPESLEAAKEWLK